MWEALGWVVVLTLGLLVASIWLKVSGSAGLAIAQDGLAYGLLLAWVIVGVSLAEHYWIEATAAGLLIGYHLGLLVPRLSANTVPAWVGHAPRLELVVANVYCDNATPEVLAQGLLTSGAQMIVIVEWNDAFIREFDDAGGREAYPHRLYDPDDHSEYAVGIVSTEPLHEGSRMIEVGPLQIVQAAVRVGSTHLTVIGLNPSSVVEPGGFTLWTRQLDALIAHVPTLREPFVVAGDFNTTTYRPKFRELLATGLVDAHESIGKGLSRSFKLAASGVLASTGPIVRLDHALLSGDVRAVEARDLASGGSDHLPFHVSLAVHPKHGRRHHHN